MSDSTVDEMIRGGCYDHALNVVGDDDGTLYLTLYENVYTKSHGHLRLAWNALRGRTSYGNEIVLNAIEVDRLIALLREHARKTRSAVRV